MYYSVNIWFHVVVSKLRISGACLGMCSDTFHIHNHDWLTIDLKKTIFLFKMPPQFGKYSPLEPIYSKYTYPQTTVFYYLTMHLSMPKIVMFCAEEFTIFRRRPSMSICTNCIVGICSQIPCLLSQNNIKHLNIIFLCVSLNGIYHGWY